MKYSLMLKDTTVADIQIIRTEYELNVTMIKVYIKQLMPLSIQSGFYTLLSWIEQRYILVYKKETVEFFRQLGIESIEQFISITHCTSLNDCYWLKGMYENIKWCNVSLYRNLFNEAIAHLALTGKILSNNIGSSPDFSTDGTFPKCWKRYNKEIYMLKAGKCGYSSAGDEPYSEVFACQLAHHLGLPIIEQTLTICKGTQVSKSRCICNESTGIVKLNEVSNKTGADFKWLLEKYNSRRVNEMLMFDYLTCNTDRHFGNIWIYLDIDTNRVKEVTELCDNNLGCIPYYVEDESLEFYIDEIRAKDGRKWDELLRLIDQNVVKELSCKAKDFKFKPLGIEKADRRVNIINRMLKYQLSKVH